MLKQAVEAAVDLQERNVKGTICEWAKSVHCWRPASELPMHAWSGHLNGGREPLLCVEVVTQRAVLGAIMKMGQDFLPQQLHAVEQFRTSQLGRLNGAGYEETRHRPWATKTVGWVTG